MPAVNEHDDDDAPTVWARQQAERARQERAEDLAAARVVAAGACAFGLVGLVGFVWLVCWLLGWV